MGNSGDYRNSFCYFLVSKLPAGNYTLLASTFDAGCLEKCIVTVGSSACLPGIAHLSASGGTDARVRRATDAASCHVPSSSHLTLLWFVV